MKNFWCKIGIHRPLTIGRILFIDVVIRKPVRNCKCPCGQEWMTTGGPWFGDKVKQPYPLQEIS